MGGMCGDGFRRKAAVQQGHVGNQKAVGIHLYTQFRTHPDASAHGLCAKPGADRLLPCGVFVLSHRALPLHDLAVDILGIG